MTDLSIASINREQCRAYFSGWYRGVQAANQLFDEDSDLSFSEQVIRLHDLIIEALCLMEDYEVSAKITEDLWVLMLEAFGTSMLHAFQRRYAK